MNAVDRYVADLAAALHVRGQARRRILAECRDHLADASAVHGPDEAVRRFGPVADVVAGFEVEVAVRRAQAATWLTAAGVAGIGASTLAVVHATDNGLTAPVAWAVVFFASAQTSAVALLLAVLRAVLMRHETGSAAAVSLLCRRNGVALGFAALTMFAAGAAVPGQTSAWRILAGPAIGVLASAALLRAGRLARRQRDREGAEAQPTPRWDLLLAPTMVLSAFGAYWWSYLDHGTVSGSFVTAGIEAACVLTGFVLLRRPLGLVGR
ncbi:MAG TPA: hypothetical protein VJ872_07680 [Nocardioides sp.]|nr:hypothetical protein [Nocardioides sp.]